MDPARYGFFFIGVSVCKERIHRMEEEGNRKGWGAHANMYRCFLTCSNDWIPHELSGDGTEEFIRNARTIRRVLQLLHLPQELMTKAYGLCGHAREGAKVPEVKTGPFKPRTLSLTQKQSEHQAERAELAHALICQKNQRRHSAI